MERKFCKAGASVMRFALAGSTRDNPRVSAAPPPLLFDRALLAARLDRASRDAGKRPGADFLLRRAADELGERLAFVNRTFALAVDAGAPGPHAAAALAARPGRGATLRLAPTVASAGSGDFSVLVGDVERLPLAAESADLVVSLLALHHVNDLPGALIQIRRALRPDGLFVAALAGGDTLTELRQSLTVAESEIVGGVSPRVAPFADARALAGLMQRAGFALPVVDVDTLIVRYADLFALMRDLRAFGAANALVERSRKPLRRALLARAAEVYAERFADPDGRLRATFETVWLTGWAPHESQPKPLRPGSATARLADALKRREGDR
jgi:SAM-dependent methyltransferase